MREYAKIEGKGNDKDEGIRDIDYVALGTCSRASPSDIRRI